MSEIGELPRTLVIPTVAIADNEPITVSQPNGRVVGELGPGEVKLGMAVILDLLGLLPAELFPVDLPPKMWWLANERNPGVASWFRIQVSVSTTIGGDSIIARSEEQIRPDFFGQRSRDIAHQLARSILSQAMERFDERRLAGERANSVLSDALTAVAVET